MHHTIINCESVYALHSNLLQFNVDTAFIAEFSKNVAETGLIKSFMQVSAPAMVNGIPMLFVHQEEIFEYSPGSDYGREQANRLLDVTRKRYHANLRGIWLKHGIVSPHVLLFLPHSDDYKFEKEVTNG